MINPHPIEFGQPLVWYDPGDIHENTVATGLSDGGDKSGNSRDATQATAGYQPSIGTLNSREIWTGDGTDDFLNCSVPLPAEGTLFVVTDPTAGAPSYILTGSDADAWPSLISGFDPGGGAVSFEWFDTNGLRTTLSASATGFHIIAITHDDAATPNTIGYFDGSQVFTGNSTSNWNGRSLVAILAHSAAVAPHTGSIAGLTLHPKVFAVWEIEQLTRYFQNRWAL